MRFHALAISSAAISARVCLFAARRRRASALLPDCALIQSVNCVMRLRQTSRQLRDCPAETSRSRPSTVVTASGLLHQHLAAGLALQPRDPWLDRPDRVDLLLLKERQLVCDSASARPAHRRRVCVIFKPAGRKPGARRNILRIAELRRRDLLPRKSAAAFRLLSGCTTRAAPPFAAPATIRTSSPFDFAVGVQAPGSGRRR